jgi:hypothetical protein
LLKKKNSRRRRRRRSGAGGEKHQLYVIWNLRKQTHSGLGKGEFTHKSLTTVKERQAGWQAGRKTDGRTDGQTGQWSVQGLSMGPKQASASASSSSSCCSREQTAGLKRGPWTQSEDHRLIQYISVHGEGCWRTLPKAAGEKIIGK